MTTEALITGGPNVKDKPVVIHTKASQADLLDVKEVQLELPMGKEEADAIVTNIKNHVGSIRELVLDLYEREGWKSLGYKSWRDCVVKEFQQGERQLYRLLDVAKVEKNIFGSVKGLPESQLRPLANKHPTKQKKIWQEATETAPEGKMSAEHVKSVVKKHYPEHEEQELIPDEREAEVEREDDEYKHEHGDEYNDEYDMNDTHEQTEDLTNTEISERIVDLLNSMDETDGEFLPALGLIEATINQVRQGFFDR